MTTTPPLVLRRDIDPRMLTRAAKAARMRGTGLHLLDLALQSTDSASGLLRRGLRDARALHSRERRLVGDLVVDLLRSRFLLTAALGTEDPLAWWLGWLVHNGLPPEHAATEFDQRSPRFVECTDLAGFAQRLPRDAAGLAVVAGVSADAAAAMLYGLEDPWAFVAASHQRAPLVLRVNQARISVKKAIRSLSFEKIEVTRSRWAPFGLVVKGRPQMATSPCLTQGLVEVQDEGSQLVAELVSPNATTVVDLCAGAGGKSLSLRARLPQAAITAADVRIEPLKELLRRAKRAAGAPIHTLTLAENGDLTSRLRKMSVDAVLVDAPCTGTGVWRRHPEYRHRLDDLPSRQAQQAAILDRAATLVRPGGELVYATCSVLRQENADQVDAFVQRHPEFTLLDASNRVPDGVTAGSYLSMGPHTHGTDGFFGAILARRR